MNRERKHVKVVAQTSGKGSSYKAFDENRDHPFYGCAHPFRSTTFRDAATLRSCAQAI